MEKKKANFTILKLLLGLTIITSIASIAYSNRKSIDAQNIVSAKPKVFNNIDKRFADVRRIRITVSEGAFNIKLHPDGWRVRERGDYFVSSEKIAQFSKEIAALELGEIAANSPQQFDELGVGEPMEFGFGTIIELFDAQDQSIAATHIGRKPNGFYVRKMGENDSYNAIGTLSPFEKVSDWLDYNIVHISNEEILSSKISLDGGTEFEILRDAAGNFQLMGKSSEKIKNAAQIIANMKFSDVAKATRISNPPIVKETIATKNGEIIELKLISQFKQYWVKLSSSSSDSTIISNHAKDWAFAIDENSAKLIMQNKFQLLKD